MTPLVWTGFAALVAALGAFVGNRLLFTLLGPRAAWLAVPWLEEAVKFVAASPLAGRPILTVSLFFGLAELLYDLVTARTDGLYLGLLSLCTHGVAGGVATLLLDATGHTQQALVAAGVVHMAINVVVVRLVLPALGAAGSRTHLER